MASQLPASVAAVGAVRPLRPPPQMHLKTSSVGFMVWWVVLLLLHAVNAGYYVGAAMLYRYMRWTNVDFQLATYSIGIAPIQYFKVSTIHAIIAALHLLFMTAMILGSLQVQRLAFLPTVPTWLARVWARVPAITIKATAPKPQSDEQRRSSLSRHISSLSETTTGFTDMIFGREGLLGVDGVYFDHLHLARELLETTLQTIQVYRMSYLLPRVWLIRFYVVLLIANCWSTPIVHRYYRNRHTQRRMMSLLCDAVLDMMSSIGVSFWIFATYLPQYTDPAFGFPMSNWFNDVWFTNMQQEFQMMLVVSWADMVSRLVFAIGLLQCMEMIKELLTPPVETRKPLVLSDKVTSVAITTPDALNDKTVRAPPAISDLAASKKTNNSTLKVSRVVKFIVEKAGPALFVVLGFAILIVHIVSETRQSSSHVPCQLKLHPWFVTKPACSLVELDCHQLGGLSGSQESMTEAWTTYEFGATARVFVRHCPLLEVPATLQQFHQLTSFKLYNSTIMSWPVEAAFTSDVHVKMCALFAIRTNFPSGQLPPGLLSTQFPRGLLSFTTSATNIQKLPNNLHELWPPVMTLVFELSALQEIPPALLKMNAAMLSFAGSPIATVPAEAFESPFLTCLLLSYTKVQELPRVVMNASPALYLLFLEGTNVSTFWSWMEPFVRHSIWLNKGFFTAHGSRFCAERDAIVAGNRTSFSITTTEPSARDLASVMDVSTPEKLGLSQSAVVCEPAFPFFFPLGLQDMATALRP